MVITAKGQVTIPSDIREKAGLLPHTEVDFVFENGAVRIVKREKAARKTRGQRLVARLRGSAQTDMTTDEIMELTRS